MQRFSIAINLEPKAHHRIEQNILRRRGVGLIGVDKDLVFPGYTLFAPLSSPNTVYLVDNDGRKVHRWILPCPPGRHARILFNGNLAFNGSLPDGPHLFLMWEKYRGGAMLQVDPQGNIVREHHDPLAHHDAHHLENGHILYTTLEELSENTGATVLGGVAGSEAPNARVYADVIKDVDADNNVIWTWKVSENLPKDVFPLQSHYSREHCPLINTVYPLKDGNILASLRSVSVSSSLKRPLARLSGIWTTMLWPSSIMPMSSRMVTYLSLMMELFAQMTASIFQESSRLTVIRRKSFGSIEILKWKHFHSFHGKCSEVCERQHAY